LLARASRNSRRANCHGPPIRLGAEFGAEAFEEGCALVRLGFEMADHRHRHDAIAVHQANTANASGFAALEDPHIAY